jgi:hypothetical protein
MPRLTDKAIQKKFGVILLIIILAVAAAFSIWYFVDRSSTGKQETAIVSEQRN